MKFYLTLILIVVLKSASAQSINNNITLTGILTDSLSKKSLAYATVSIRSENENYLKTVLTNEEGRFSVKDMKAGKYILSIISLGYEKKALKLDLTSSLDLGTIALRENSNTLKEVVVYAERSLVRHEDDKLVYDLQADPESRSNSALEMMRKVPMLSVDGDDNIQLRGDANYKILVNGKPSSMMERNAKEILKNMPASTLQSIEVITNPSSKYDAEGIAGIINIITNKKVDQGYNGSVTASNRLPAGGPTIGGSGTMKKNKLGMSAFGGLNSAESPETRSSLYRKSLASTLVQQGGRESNSAGGYFGSDVSIEIDSLNLISAQVSYNRDKNTGTNFQLSELNSASETLQRYRLAGTNSGFGTGIDAALNYQLGFRNHKNQLLTLSYRFYEYKNQQENQLASTEILNYINPDFIQNNTGGSREQTMQIDYVQPIKRLNIEAGLKAIRRNNNSDFQFNVEGPSGGFVIDPDRSNLFENIQQVYSFYNSYSYTIKQWSLKGGYRLEQTLIDADFISSKEFVKQKYLNLIPAFSISRRTKDMQSFSLVFSQRIQRPGIYQLNPFVDRSNPNVESTGNPDLHPTVGSTFSLNYSLTRKASLNVSLGHNIFTDLIMPISIYDPATFITRSSYDNTGRADLTMLNVNFNYPVSAKLTINGNGGLAYGHVSGLVNNIRVENKGLMYQYSGSGSVRLKKGWRVNASVSGKGPNLSLQGTSNSFISSSFSANKDLVSDKLSLSAAINNPFHKFRVRTRESFGPDFDQSFNDWQFYRSFNTSLTYKFGKLKTGLKKNSRGIRNDDVSNNLN